MPATKHSTRSVRIAASMLVLAACYGGVGGRDPAADGDSSGSAATTAPDGTATDDGGSTGDTPDDASCADEVAIPMRQLTHAQYANAIEALLSIDAGPWVAEFPAEAELDGFLNQADAQSLTVEHARRYQQAAEAIVGEAFADPTIVATIVPCDPSADATCLQAFVQKWGRLAYRRALTDAEVDNLVTMSVELAEPDPLSPFVIAAEAILQSPNFLFQVARGARRADDPERIDLDGPSIATRLSFLLLDSPPDAWLLDAAEADELATATGLRDAAVQLLDDPRARVARVSFAAQWLQLSKIDGAAVSSEAYPAYSAELTQSARTELEWLAERALAPGGDIAELLLTDRGYVDARLAEVYGEPAPAQGFAEITFTDPTTRGGLLGTVGFALSTSHYLETSVVQRGLFVRRHILCSEIPNPPPGIDTVPEPGEDELEASDARLEDGSCSTCHRQIDLVGRGLEIYDPVGRVRATYRDGAALPNDGELVEIDDGGFATAPQLAELIVAQGGLSVCAAKKLFHYGAGRRPVGSDACIIDELTQAVLDAGGDFDAAVIAFATHPTFRQRRVEDLP